MRFWLRSSFILCVFSINTLVIENQEERVGVARRPGEVSSSDGLASPHQARIVREAVQAGGNGADRGRQEAVLQRAR